MARSVLKRLVSRVAGRVDLPRGLMGRNGHTTILYYHRVVEEWEPTLELAVSVEAFEAQVAYLTERWKVIPLDEVEAHWRKGAPLPPRSVAITFDDGYQDNYRCAFPILKRYGVPAAIFLTTAHMGTGKTFWWDRATVLYQKASPARRLKDVIRGYGAVDAPTAEAWVKQLQGWSEAKRAAVLDDLEALTGPIDGEALPKSLSWEQIREMAAWGITIGSHTRTHRDLTRLDPEELEREVRGSKEEIEKHLETSVRFFSYPFNRLDRRVEEAVARAGYALAFAGQDPASSLYSVPRRKVKEGHTWGFGRQFSPALFEAEISGLLDRIFLRSWR